MQGGLRIHGITKKSDVNLPLVSIITVVFNGEKFLEQTLKSVFSQRYSNIEYIVIDGGSTDRTLDIIKQYENQIDYWQSEADKGIYFAMNKGIHLAKGDIIGILNADDYYFEDTVTQIVDYYHKTTSDIYHGDMLVINDMNKKQAEEHVKPEFSKMKEKPSVFHPTCFVKKSVYDQMGCFDTQFKLSSDYEFLLRCIYKNYTFQYIPKLITAFRTGGKSASCYSNVEGYQIMKRYDTGFQNHVIWRGIKCYIKTFLKKVIYLKK